MTTVEQLIQYPSSLRKGNMFYFTRGTYVEEGTCVGLCQSGIIYKTGYGTNYFIRYDVLNSDPAFLIVSRRKKIKWFWQRKN